MHLVFVSSLLPVENPGSGFDIANSVILDVLRAQDDVRISTIGYKSPSAILSHPQGATVLGEMEVTTDRVSRIQQLKWLSAALLNRTSFSSTKMLTCGQYKLTSSLASLKPIDGLILNSVQLPGAFMKTFNRYPSIFVAHNVEARSAVENSRHAGGAFEKWLFQREAKYLSRLEQGLCRQAKFVWTLSDEDRKTLGVASNEKSAVLPLVTRITPPVAGGDTVVPTYDIGLIGTWSWRPNHGFR